ncbi:hypothetical protein J5N97_024985 [Dioscorea zingiberensis]|uniref:Uncharacterized protein n=1 Tax=Dioscorea zingiberensis TaxID=325984 RepID=A0A9D5C889_9LILI|nr:hypothetical protein J5N97_024985 [Dioscorea zingiberensis]
MTISDDGIMMVSINDLDGKIVALYFDMGYTMGIFEWLGQELVELYTELTSKGENFEVVYIGDHRYGDEEEEEEFKACFSKMPWLAIPPLELEIQEHLRDKFKPLLYAPVLPILDGRSRLLTFDGYEAFQDYDSDAYPFTPEKHTELKLKEDEQPLQFLLGSQTRDFLIAYNGTEVPLSELEGKKVGVFFLPEYDDGGCEELIQSMKTKLEKSKEAAGEEFELVIVPIEVAYNEEKMNKVNFQHVFKDLACLSIPLSDKRCCKRLVRRFYSADYPNNLMIIGADRSQYDDYLITCEDNQEFPSQSLESLLSSADRDYVIGKDDVKVKISNLQGRTVILYLAPEAAESVWYYNTCTKFLVEAYHELHSKGEDLEESHNKLKDQFPNETRGDLPHLLVRDGSGDIICTPQAAFWDLLNYGPEAYPFTNERIDQIKKEDEILKKQPQNLHKLLGSDTRDFLISSNRDKVPISELQGKIVALYLRSLDHHIYGQETYQILKDMYFKLKERGEKFELVSVFHTEDMPNPPEEFQGMPWLAVPLNDQETIERLFRYFHVFNDSNLIVIDSQGMILNNSYLPDFLTVVNYLGDEGYPFTLEKIHEVLSDERCLFTLKNYNFASIMPLKRRIMMKPESVFVSWQRDYLFGKDGIKGGREGIDEALKVSDIVTPKTSTTLRVDCHRRLIQWCMQDLLDASRQKCTEDVNKSTTGDFKANSEQIFCTDVFQAEFRWMKPTFRLSVHGNVRIGIQAAENRLLLEPGCAATHVQLAKLYASVGCWNQVARVRKLMKERGLKTVPGYSWIEIGNAVYRFKAEDGSNKKFNEILNVLDCLADHMKFFLQ